MAEAKLDVGSRKRESQQKKADNDIQRVSGSPQGCKSCGLTTAYAGSKGRRGGRGGDGGGGYSEHPTFNCIIVHADNRHTLRALLVDFRAMHYSGIAGARSYILIQREGLETE